VKWGFPVGLVSGIVLGVVGATYGTPHISREALSAAPLRYLLYRAQLRRKLR
jgi:hypothetical protein